MGVDRENLLRNSSLNCSIESMIECVSTLVHNVMFLGLGCGSVRE